MHYTTYSCFMQSNERRIRLGVAIREERVRQHLSQEKFAYMIGSDQSYVSRLERGEYNLKFDHLCEIADALNLDVSELLNR
ncbi:helix-turn-helix domain-containing protein [Gordonibacter sp.]|uniref:helix-turn-helix domain-containing protein n=1 Tax=Gordonibacter sp. TaxID=1968902 RepID=UPI003FA56AC4